MNFSVPLQWFQQAVGYEVSIEDIERHSGDLGFDVQIHSSDFNEPLVVVAKIVGIRQHPNAERLNLCLIDDGSGIEQEIVCGCPSVKTGILVPFAKLHAKLPSVTIKSSSIRGIESNGMLCSRADLGLENKSSGLWVLDPGYELGQPLFSAMAYDRPTLVFEVTANRKDCLSLEGIAREWCALINKKSVPLPIRLLNDCIRHPYAKEIAVPTFVTEAHWVKIKINNLALPDHWAQRLHMLGLYTNDPILNIQRLAEIEFGLPLHIYGNLQGNNWTVERLKHDVLWKGLDDVDYLLKPGDVVVCLDGEVVALAGMLGGFASKYQSGSNEFWVEALEINHAYIHATQKHLGLNTSAALRMARGVAPGLSGHTLSGFLDNLRACADVSVEQYCYAGVKKDLKKILLRTDSIVKILGFDPGSKLDEVLGCLGFSFDIYADGSLDVHVPWYRSDLDEECDIIEEIIRYIGYDALQECLPDLPCMQTAVVEMRDKVDDYLSASGFDEVIHYSFIEAHWDEAMGLDAFSSITLANPISSDLSVMRRSLMPGMLKTAQYRANNQQPSAWMFEWGRSYTVIENQPCEVEILALWMSGDRFEDCPLQPKRPVDYYDLLGRIESLYTWLGCSLTVKKNRPQSQIIHPDVSASLWFENKCVGHVGMVHPKFTENYPHAYYAELSAVFFDELSHVPDFKEFNRAPVVFRDLSLWCPEGLSYEIIDNFIRQMDIIELKSWTMVDTYSAQGAGQRQSISLRLCLSGKQKSLKDSDVERIISMLLSKMSEILYVELRRNENVNAS